MSSEVFLFSSIFGKSLCGTGIISFLNVWENSLRGHLTQKLLSSLLFGGKVFIYKSNFFNIHTDFHVIYFLSE